MADLIPLHTLELALLDQQHEEVRAFFEAADLASGNASLLDAAREYGFQAHIIDPAPLNGQAIMLARDLAKMMYGSATATGVGQLLRSYGFNFLRIEGFSDQVRTLVIDRFGLSKFDGKAAFATWQHFLIVGMYGQTDQARKVKAYLLKREKASRVADKVEESTGLSPRQVAASSAGDLLVQMAEAYRDQERRLQLTEAKAQQATENAVRALESQLFFTVAEYVCFNNLKRQVPESAYKALSDHLRLYCLDNGVPFRKIPIGGKRWDDEYGFHVSTWAEAFPGWIARRFSQTDLQLVK